VSQCKKLADVSLKEISIALMDSSYQQTVKNKLEEVKQQIIDYSSHLNDCKIISEEALAFYMSLCPLTEELKSTDDGSQINRSSDKETRRLI
jgi:hypothetical protein